MKTPEEIKKGLSKCGKNSSCRECPYYEYYSAHCVHVLHAEAYTLIRKLEEDVQRGMGEL